MGDAYDTGHGLPSDFPSDPSYTLYFVFGGLFGLLLIALIAAAIVGFLNGYGSRRRSNFDDWPLRLSEYVNRQNRLVTRPSGPREQDTAPIEGIWSTLLGRSKPQTSEIRRNVPDISPARARVVVDRVRRLMGNNLTLAKEMSGELKRLNEALEGYKEIKDTAPFGAASPASHATGTVINIAVNNGSAAVPGGETPAALPGPYAQPASPVQGLAQMFEARPISKEANVKLAFDKFEDEWRRPAVMAAQLKAAQAALCTRPPEPPRPA